MADATDESKSELTEQIPNNSMTLPRDHTVRTDEPRALAEILDLPQQTGAELGTNLNIMRGGTSKR